jgi:hypothetical protein
MAFPTGQVFAANSKGDLLMTRWFASGALSLCALILGTQAAAQSAPACSELPSLPPLKDNPAVFEATAVQQVTGGRTFCMVSVKWRDPLLVGASAGYAPGTPPQTDTFQHVRIGIALPLNTDTGAGAWGGRLIMTAGGGSQGSVPGLTGMIAMNPPAIGAGTDSGHGDTAFGSSGGGESWGVIQGSGLNHGKLQDWAEGRSNGIAVRLAKQMAVAYYGQPVARTYWQGFSGGGHMGWAQMQFYPEEYDGALIGAPAHHWQKFRLADSWDEVVRKKVGQQTSPITAAQFNAANAAAVAACDGQDGVVDGLLADPRTCTWSATNHVCGVPGAPGSPLCLDSIQAAGIDRMWDGPRNSYGKRIWHAYDRGINLGISTNTQNSTQQVLRFATYDLNFSGSNLYEDQESIALAAAAGADVSRALTYEAAAELVTGRTADYTDTDFPRLLETARAQGIKIIVYHGTADGAIHWRNDVDFYTRVAAHFGRGTPDFAALQSWYRFFIVPGVGHTAQPLLNQLISWVEEGVAPDRIHRASGFPVLCPFPQKAIHTGGSASDPANFVCGGDVQTPEVICLGLRTPYKREAADELQAYGRYNPSTCATSRK